MRRYVILAAWLVAGLILLGTAAVRATTKPAPAIVGTRAIVVPQPPLSQTVPCGTSASLAPWAYQADPTETHYEARLLAQGSGAVTLCAFTSCTQVPVNSPGGPVPVVAAVDLPGPAPTDFQLSVTLAGGACPGGTLTGQDLNLRAGP